jgi:hypothetical protein
LRNDFRKPLAAAHGLTLQLVDVSPEPADEQRSYKRGERKEGCTPKVDVSVRRVAAKVNVSSAEQPTPSERTLSFTLAEADARWYLLELPLANVSKARVFVVLTKLVERMCACKDLACAQAVKSELEEAVTPLFDEIMAFDEAQQEEFAKLGERWTKCEARISTP